MATQGKLERSNSQGSDPGGRPRSDSAAEISRRMRTLSGSIQEYERVVVVAVDPSEIAKNAFNYYLTNVHKNSDLIVIAHCPEPPKLPSLKLKSGFSVPVEDWKKTMEEMNSTVRKIEEDYEGTCINKKLKYKVRGESVRKPGEGICRIADEEKADMIVIGTRGAGMVKRALLGSVSEYVVRNSGIPTLIVSQKK